MGLQAGAPQGTPYSYGHCQSALPPHVLHLQPPGGHRRGTKFSSHVWSAFCVQLGINISLTSSCHLQANGQAERLNQELGYYLYCTYTVAMDSISGVSSSHGQSTPKSHSLFGFQDLSVFWSCHCLLIWISLLNSAYGFCISCFI